MIYFTLAFRILWIAKKHFHHLCRNPSLELVTKAKVCEGPGQEWTWESHFMLSGVQESVREWTLTLPSEFPLWELDFQWISKSLKGNSKGQNSLTWKVPYILGNLLELKCLKWARMTHLDTSNTSYGQKKGWESNWQFDSWPLKVKNHPNFLAFRWLITYHWKAFDKGYNSALNLISIGCFHTKL
jgi:hypothetical protein